MPLENLACGGSPVDYVSVDGYSRLSALLQSLRLCFRSHRRALPESLLEAEGNGLWWPLTQSGLRGEELRADDSL